MAINCPQIVKRTSTLGDFPLTYSDQPMDGIPRGFCPRQTTLDKILVEAAVEAGAELREGFPVTEVLWDGENVTGIAGRSKSGYDS